MRRLNDEKVHTEGQMHLLGAFNSRLDISMHEEETDRAMKIEEKKLHKVQKLNDDKDNSTKEEKNEERMVIAGNLSFPMEQLETEFINRLSDPNLPLAELKKLLLRFFFPSKFSPLPQNLGRVRLCVMKNNTGLVKKFYPEYKLYLRDNDRFLMAGKKMQLMRSAYYLISTEVQVTNRKTAGCLGKLRSNFQGTEFDLFGIGENPKKRVPFDQVRAQHAAVIYDLMGIKEGRGRCRMDVLLPKASNDNEPNNWRPITVKL